VRAAVYYGANDVRIEEVERPAPGYGELLVKMRACGLCGSDLLDWYVEPRAPLDHRELVARRREPRLESP
jgi:L-iditol 2-dehydrogenase